MQSTFSMAKAMWVLFAKSKGQSNRYGTVYNNVMFKVHVYTIKFSKNKINNTCINTSVN